MGRKRHAILVSVLVLSIVYTISTTHFSSRLDLKTQAFSDCNKLSAKCQIKTIYTPPPTTNATTKPLRVLYYNTHGGCTANLRAIAPLLSKPIQLTLFNPSQVSSYGMTRARATRLIASGHVSFICSLADIIVISDTIPHGRAILEALVHPPDSMSLQCNTRKVILEMTNRFDWDIAAEEEEADGYYAMMRELFLESTTRDGGKLFGRVFWVGNNLAEGRWVEGKLGVKVGGNVRLLRPMGMVDGVYAYPKDLPVQNQSTVATQLHKTLIHSYLVHELNLTDYLTRIPFGHKYGGPLNLLAFKAFLDIPYQYSTMKLYENIAHGVPVIVPTPRFLLELYYSGLHAIPLWDPYNLGVLNKAIYSERYSTGWARYVDYYDDELKPFLYYFDSFGELGELLRRRLPVGEGFDGEAGKRVRVLGPVYYAKARRAIVDGWDALLV